MVETAFMLFCNLLEANVKDGIHAVSTMRVTLVF